MTDARATLAATLGVASDLAQLVEGELEGHPSAGITGVEMLEDARAGDLTFVGDAKYARRWSESGATELWSAKVVTKTMAAEGLARSAWAA